MLYPKSCSIGPWYNERPVYFKILYLNNNNVLFGFGCWHSVVFDAGGLLCLIVLDDTMTQSSADHVKRSCLSGKKFCFTLYNVVHKFSYIWIFIIYSQNLYGIPMQCWIPYAVLDPPIKSWPSWDTWVSLKSKDHWIHASTTYSTSFEVVVSINISTQASNSGLKDLILYYWHLGHKCQTVQTKKELIQFFS